MQHWHLLVRRILFLLHRVRSWDIRQWDGCLLAMSLRHVLYYCWRVDKVDLQCVFSRLFFLVVMAAIFLYRMR